MTMLEKEKAFSAFLQVRLAHELVAFLGDSPAYIDICLAPICLAETSDSKGTACSRECLQGLLQGLAPSYR